MNKQQGEVVEMYCVRCKQRVEKPSDFRTPEYLRIYMMTGMCQTCQDLETRKEETLGRIGGRE